MVFMPATTSPFFETTGVIQRTLSDICRQLVICACWVTWWSVWSMFSASTIVGYGQHTDQLICHTQHMGANESRLNSDDLGMCPTFLTHCRSKTRIPCYSCCTEKSRPICGLVSFDLTANGLQWAFLWLLRRDKRTATRRFGCQYLEWEYF